jgi:hypothetical protein
MNLLVSPPPQPDQAPPPIRVQVSVAAENFEIDGPVQAEITVPLEGNSPAVYFRLRGLEPGPGRVMIDFAQDGRPTGSVDLAPMIVAEIEAVRANSPSVLPTGPICLSLGSGLLAPAPDLVLKVFEHRLAGNPGQLHFVLSSTHRALADLPIFDGDLGTLDLRAEIGHWVDEQLRSVGSLAGQTDVTPDEAELTLARVGCNLFRKLLTPALQDLSLTFRARGVRTMMVLSDEPHIPWELIKPFRADPLTGAIIEEGPFWGESFALTHWLRGRPPASGLSIKRAITMAAGSAPAVFGSDRGEDRVQAPAAALLAPGPGATRDMVLDSKRLSDGTTKGVGSVSPRPGAGIPPVSGSDPGADFSALASAAEEQELSRLLESMGSTVARLPARRKALRDALEQGKFDLLHLATHGMFSGTDAADASAVLLEDGVFTAAHLSPLMAGPLRECAPLVFFNTCHSGRLGFCPTCLGSWGAHLVDLGCGGFIGALWPVTDRAAVAFARAFYEMIAQRQIIREAVRIARHRVREQFPDDPSWLAYRCFADPMARLEASPS